MRVTLDGLVIRMELSSSLASLGPFGNPLGGKKQKTTQATLCHRIYVRGRGVDS